MKVFLSWSGTTSHKVACVLREWLPSVIQAIRPYVSSEDIDKGARWSSDIAKELHESAFGIICVTRSNLSVPWVNFEAGALSKTIDKAFVSPFLFKIKRSEVQGPLLQFQSTVYDRDDIYKLLASMNARLKADEQLDDAHLKRTFDVWWADLQTRLDAITDDGPPADQTPELPASNAILEELLDLARNQQRLLRSPDELLPPEYLSFALDRTEFHSRRALDSEIALDRLHGEIIEAEQLLGAFPESCQDAPAYLELRRIFVRVHDLIHRYQRRRPPLRRRVAAPPPKDNAE